jgi:predicted short-subunit dehydrogenase-like oxidoreductase (DUF2520 family)
MARTVSIVGAGRVGISLGKHLRELGWRIGAVITRSKSTAGAAVRTIGAGKPFDRLTTDLCDADLILFGTPDDGLPGIARRLARVCGARCKGKIILHTSATLDRSALAPLARLGASTGSLHPMQAFGGKVVPNLKGVIFGIEGDAKARRLAQSLAKSLGGIPVVIETADKPAYHAAAVMAGGSIYPLLEAGLQLLISIGFTRQRASQTLLPLLHQILDNVEGIGPRAAWTGPLSRGDYAVVAKHMKVLRRYPPEFAKSYAALAELAARVLSKDPAATREQLEPALGSGSKV